MEIVFSWGVVLELVTKVRKPRRQDAAKRGGTAAG
jgi:hypothetical protein